MTYEEFREAVKELVSSGRYPSKKSCTLPALWIAEKNFPRIDHEIMRIIASELEIPLVEVEEAAEFYAMFHTKPKGKYVIRVCTNLSCMLNGAEEIGRSSRGSSASLPERPPPTASSLWKSTSAWGCVTELRP